MSHNEAVGEAIAILNHEAEIARLKAKIVQLECHRTSSEAVLFAALKRIDDEGANQTMGWAREIAQQAIGYTSREAQKFVAALQVYANPDHYTFYDSWHWIGPTPGVNLEVNPGKLGEPWHTAAAVLASTDQWA